MPRGRPKKKSFQEEVAKQSATSQLNGADVAEAKTPETTGAKTYTTQKRVVKNSETVWHDLFKLTTSIMKKNTSYNPKFPQLEDVEHTHFFHTVDSNGKALNESATIGGHFHIIETEPTAPGQPPKIISVSGPKKWAKKEIAPGKYKKVAVDLSEYDNHTHDIEYRYSEEIQVRKSNPQAVQVQTSEAQKLAPPPGIQG